MNLLCLASTVMQNVTWFIFRSKDWCILKETATFTDCWVPHSHLAFTRTLEAGISSRGQCCFWCTHTPLLHFDYWQLHSPYCFHLPGRHQHQLHTCFSGHCRKDQQNVGDKHCHRSTPSPRDSYFDGFRLQMWSLNFTSVIYWDMFLD